MKPQERELFAAITASAAREKSAEIDAETRPFSLASIGLRCGAFLLDYILMMLLPALTLALALIFKRASLGISYFILAFGYAATLGLLLFNWVYLCGLRGQTLGKRIIGIRVVRADGRPPDFKTAAIRHLGGYPLAFFCFGLGLLWMLWDAKQQGWHDKLAGTLVIKET
jgi:uncharacterized RDD family membrane protein YckC